MNIVWQKQDQTLAVTTILDGTPPITYAEKLRLQGDVPVEWAAIAFNHTTFPDAPQIAWRWNGVSIIDNGDRLIPTLSMRQARLALLNMGLLATVEAAITTTENKIWWEYSPTVERSNPLVIAVLTALGKTSAEIDAMFIQASTL